MAKVSVDETKCTGCGSCAAVCPIGMYEIKEGKSTVKAENAGKCLGCHACEVQCPNQAITVED